MLASGLIALALLGADGGPPEGACVATQVRVLEMKGVGWRGPAHARLRVVAQQGGTTVWTADREAIAAILEAADSVTMTPRVVSNPMAEAVVHASTTRRFVAQLGRVADGPVNKATAVAYQPQIESVQDGCRVHVQGRALDQGVLASVRIDDARFVAFHTVACPEQVNAKAEGGKAQTISGCYQVPDVLTANVTGEWLIPKDGALLISTGAHTLPEGKKKSVVCERLVVIEAKPAPAPAAIMPPAPYPAGGVPDLARFEAFRRAFPNLVLPDPAIGRVAYLVPAPGAIAPQPAAAPMPAAGVLSPEPAAIGTAALPAHPRAVPAMPQVPSRALPRGQAPDGSAAPLPPLPDDEADAASFEEESSEPRPTPQASPRPAKPDDLARGDADGKPEPVVLRFPLGPATGEVKLERGTPNRLSVGLRLGSRNVGIGRAVDESVTRTAAAVPAAAAEAACAAGDSDCCEEARGKPKAAAGAATFDLRLGSTADAPAAKGRPVRIEWPVADGTIEVEIRATRRTAR